MSNYNLLTEMGNFIKSRYAVCIHLRIYKPVKLKFYSPKDAGNTRTKNVKVRIARAYCQRVYCIDLYNNLLLGRADWAQNCVIDS